MGGYWIEYIYLSGHEKINNRYRRHISFWFDTWSVKSALFDLMGARRIIDMGVKKDESLEDAALNSRRRRRHRTSILNDIEEDLNIVASKLNPMVEDVSLWRKKTGFKQDFSIRETRHLLRESKPQCSWARGVSIHDVVVDQE